MWSELLSNGKYRFRERYQDPYTGKTSKTPASVILTSNSKQASNKAAVLLQRKIEKIINEKRPIDITFGEVIKEWKPVHAGTVKSRTMRDYKRPLEIITNFVDPNIPMRNIDSRLLQKFFSQLDYAPNTISLIKQPLGLIIKYSIRMGYINKNPLENVITKRREENAPDEEYEFFETDEIRDILKKIREKPQSETIANFSELLFLTGLRPGEALALKWKDIDFDNKILNVHGTLDYTSNGHANAIVTSTKTHKNRKVTLPKRAIDILIQEKKHQIITNLISDFVFVSKNRNHLSINTVDRNIKKNAIALTEKKLTSHGLRHAHITMLAELGIPLKATMDRVGHSDMKTTLKIYTHVTNKMSNQVADKIDEFII